MTATLIGVGVGPGDPELLTIRALRVLRAADRVVAPSTAVDAVGRAESIVREAAPEVMVERIPFAMAPGAAARAATAHDAAVSITGWLDAGERVAFITLGDPNIYSTFSAVAAEVRHLRPAASIETVPGIMAFQELAARTSTVLLDGTESLTIVTALDGPEAVAAAASDPARAVVVYKGGRHLPAVAKALAEAGRLDGAVFGELLGLAGERVAALTDVAGQPATYLATMLVPPRASVISFVGAGPGAADLITLRGAARLASADVVIWASSLVPEAVLEHARAGCVIHDSATMTLEDVLGVYAGQPAAAVVRLHSGDPSLYGAIQEQIEWCIANERPWEIVPGVSSLAAAAAAAGRELTIPGVSQSVVITRLAGRTAASMPARESIAAFSAHGATMAVFLSAARPAELQAELTALGSAYDAGTPAAIVIRASWPDEQVIPTTVGALSDDLVASGATMTVLVLIGDALRDMPRRSHLYAPDYAHTFRRRSTAGTTAGRPARRSRRS